MALTAHCAYFAVISCILYSQDKLRSIRRQQVSVLSLIPLLSVQNLEGKQYHKSCTSFLFI